MSNTGIETLTSKNLLWQVAEEMRARSSASNRPSARRYGKARQEPAIDLKVYLVRRANIIVVESATLTSSAAAVLAPGPSDIWTHS
jgi:hypothetical protein